jgi:threonine dehydrogenase-like Zn-dependent dehydrogenase
MFFPLGYSAGEFAETARAFESARFRPDIMVSDVIALEELPATLDKLRDGAKSLKVHVDPSLDRSAHG